MLSIADFSVILTGASPETRQTAALLIDRALRDNGFSGVDVVDEKGVDVKLPECSLSLFETIVQGAPHFFDTHVVIQEVKVRTYDGSFSEGKPTTHRSTYN